MEGGVFLEYLTPKEVAERCKVNVASVWRWIRQGKLKADKLGNGKLYRIKQDDFNKFAKGV